VRETLLALFVQLLNLASMGFFSLLPMLQGIFVKVMTGGDRKSDEVARVDLNNLTTALVFALPVFFAAVLISVSAAFMGQLVGVRFRKALTRELTSLYLMRDNFFRMQLATHTMQNPDQVMASDVAQMVRLTWGGVNPPYESSFIKLFGAAALLVLSTRNCITLGGVGISAAIMAFSFSTLALNWWISLPIETLTAIQEEHEGRLRFLHMRIHVYAEHIAMLRGIPFEADGIDSALAVVLANQSALVWAYMKVKFSVSLTTNSTQMFNTIISCIPLFTGQLKVYDVAQLSQLQGAMGQVATTFEALPTALPQIATASGMADRIVALHDTLLALAQAGEPPIEILDTPYRLGFELLTLRVPDRSMLVAVDLRLIVARGVSTILCGDSGCGKSSLIRCLAGLWYADSGIIYRPSSIMFLPQKPYFCVGNLRDQILYPSNTKTTDKEASALLRALQLSPLLDRYGLDQTVVWEEVLSGGEQQRLSFARALAQRPTFAVLDESTSAMDLTTEQLCMTMLVNAGITCLSVGHRPSVEKYHQRKLVLRRSHTDHRCVNLEEILLSASYDGDDAPAKSDSDKLCTGKLF